MLALSRKRNEAIVLDNGVRIEVVRLSRTRVTLGVQAPDHVRVLRGELVGRSEATAVDAPVHPCATQ